MTEDILFTVVYHGEVKKNQIDRIIDLKQKYWNYSYKSQLTWINNNLNCDDMHILATKGDVLVGYLDVIKVDVSTDNTKYNMLGLGNVCVNPAFRKSGIGKLCVLKANEIINNEKMSGILLCADRLTGFYKKCDWDVLVIKGKKYVADKEFLGNVMLYGSELGTKLCMCKRLVISRNF